VANTRQQRKRIRLAERQRLQNRQFTSRIKTFTKRLQAAVEAGEADQVATTRAELQKTIDKAAAKGIIHRNTAARRKSRMERIAAGTGA
jgi:small subunit ribosomal protein S20